MLLSRSLVNRRLLLEGRVQALSLVVLEDVRAQANGLQHSRLPCLTLPTAVAAPWLRHR